MIDMVGQKTIQDSPAANIDELFKRLIPLRGKVLLVDVPQGRRIDSNPVGATTELGTLSWIRYERDTSYIYIDLGGTARYENRCLGFVNIESSIWVELDGELRPVHIPEGKEREI